MNIQGIEPQMAELEAKIIKLIQGAEFGDLPNTLDDVSIFFARGGFSLNDLATLVALEERNSEEENNVWLAGVLVKSGRYVDAGKGFVDLKRDHDDVDETIEVEAVVP
jgi:hypothetical protein